MRAWRRGDRRAGSGGAWQPGQGTASRPLDPGHRQAQQHAADDWANTIAAAPGAGGSLWSAFGTNADSIVVHHTGHAPVEFGFPACCVTNQGIGTDARTGTAFVTYLSTVSPRHSGLFAQRLTAAGRRSGAPIRLPGSDIGGSPLVNGQRITTTGLARAMPGVYVTYRTGNAAARDVVLYKIGAHRAVTVALLDAPQVDSGSTLATDPFGRLWLAWFRGETNGVGLWVRRAKTGAGQFGQIKNVALPAGTQNVWKVYINAQARKLDLLVLMQVKGKTAYWTTQVLPPRQ